MIQQVVSFVLAFFSDESPESMVDNFIPVNPQKRSTGTVYIGDQRLVGECEIAERSKFIQVKVPVS